MMAVRLISAAFLVVCLSLSGKAQMKASPDVGIDEKLGAPVALDTVLKNEQGNDVRLRDYVDKPTILTFVYLRCPGVCPVLINSLAKVINETKLEPGKDFRLVAVSFDPSDTPELAREKKANYLNQLQRPFSPGDWHFLTGTAANSRIVADSAGFRYRQEGDMFVHPGAIMLLTPEGVLSRYIYGNTFVTADVEMAIKEAAGGQVRPTVSRMLAFCYTYDPEGRGYVFSVTRFAGAVTLVVAGVFLIFVFRKKPRRHK
ncbi:MAG: SCO family protein [Acidobacteria bacterium]|nr:SCO family protein [Acidobacteriota bacterium]